MPKCWVLLVLLLFAAVTAASIDNGEESVDDPGRLGPAPFPDESVVNQPVAQSSPGLRAGSIRFSVGDGFFFHRQRVAAGRAYLRCVLSRSNPPCPVRAVMNNDGSNFVVVNGAHNHDPDPLHDQVQRLRDSLMDACRARPNVRVDVIYHEVCRNVHRDVSARVSLLSIRPSMVRAQSEHRPIIPHSFEELNETMEANLELRQTLDGEELLYRGAAGVQPHRSLIFMSDRVVLGIGALSHVFGDATFYSRPNSPASAQLFTLVTMRDNHVIPLMHALMESRTEQAYRDLFNLFRQLAPNVDPEFIVTDFERALQVSLQAAFPRARLTGCLWHYSRAVCRNVRTLGLHALVRDVDNARRIVRMAMGIPLAPGDRLQEALNCVIVESRRLNLVDQFLEFFQYIRETWVLGVGNTLSVFGVRHRTNNVAECHHRNLNSRLVRRPNIWRFLELLTETEDTAWRDLGRIEVGLAPSRGRRVSSLLNDARVRSLSRQLIQREIDMTHFLSAVSWHLDNSMRSMLVEREDQERPASPERAPPRIQSQTQCLVNMPGNHHDHLNSLCPESDSDMQSGVFQPFDVASQSRMSGNNTLQRVDDAAMYHDLVDDNYYHEGSVARGTGRSRGRRQRGRSVLRGRGGRPSSVLSQPRPLSSERLPSEPLPSQVRNHRLPADQQVCSLRSEQFSDEEFLPDDEEDEVRSWQECIICFSRVAHYTILGCGAFPVCGLCIRQWFIRQYQQLCPHCGAATPGWLRLDFL